jgi:hypothetical protein
VTGEEIQPRISLIARMVIMKLAGGLFVELPSSVTSAQSAVAFSSSEFRCGPED